MKITIDTEDAKEAINKGAGSALKGLAWLLKKGAAILDQAAAPMPPQAASSAKGAHEQKTDQHLKKTNVTVFEESHKSNNQKQPRNEIAKPNILPHYASQIRDTERNPENIATLQFKSEQALFARHITTKNIRYLYHFTDKENLPLIWKHGGLYSWNDLEKRNICPPKMGGNELSRSLDRKKGLEDYVRLCFTKKHPMQHVVQNDGRINNIVFIEIDPGVIYWKDTLFSDKNATSNDARTGPDFGDFQLIDLNLIKSGKWANAQEKALFQAEVMVKNYIPCKYFMNQSLLKI